MMSSQTWTHTSQMRIGRPIAPASPRTSSARMPQNEQKSPGTAAMPRGSLVPSFASPTAYVVSAETNRKRRRVTASMRGSYPIDVLRADRTTPISEA